MVKLRPGAPNYETGEIDAVYDLNGEVSRACGPDDQRAQPQLQRTPPARLGRAARADLLVACTKPSVL